MNAAGQVAVREDAALNLLKARLGVTQAVSTPPVDLFLLRFMRNKKLDVDETIDKLRRRREFELSLPGIAVTPSCVQILRSGALSLLGVDVLRRPVLCVRWNLVRSLMSEAEEMEKLVIVLLEFMQSVAFSSPQQEIVVVVTQQDASWYQASNALQFDYVVTLLSKYYPDLVGLVLVVDPPWTTRQQVKSALAGAASSRARNLLQIVTKNELHRYVDPSILPEDLGGRHASESPQDFCERVLRYWYSVVTLVTLEIGASTTNGNSGGGGGGVSGLPPAIRPLYVPTASAVGSSSATQLPSYPKAMSYGATTTTSTPYSTSSMRRGSALTPRRKYDRTGVNLNASLTAADATTDDGMCSVISENDIDIADDDVGVDGAGVGAAAAAAALLGSSGGGDGIGQLPEATAASQRSLTQELRAERERRLALEHELSRLRLGITLDSVTMTSLESALRQVHDEVNVMISEVISAAKRATPAAPAPRPSTSSSTSPSSRSKGRHGPNLHQLMEMTDALVLEVTQERQQVGAMKFATPPADRTADKRWDCCLM